MREDAWLLERLETAHEEWGDTYGAPRIHAEFQGMGVGRKRVARLIDDGGLVGVSRRRGTSTTSPDGDRRPAPDLVDRDLTRLLGGM